MDRNQTIRYTPRRQGWPEETVSPPRPARPKPSPQLRRRRRQLRRMKAAALLLFLLVLLAAATQNALNGDRSSPTDSPDPVSQEVWHYRYVGVEAAQEIYTQGLCLEEYLA